MFFYSGEALEAVDTKQVFLTANGNDDELNKQNVEKSEKCT